MEKYYYDNVTHDRVASLDVDALLLVVCPIIAIVTITICSVLIKYRSSNYVPPLEESVLMVALEVQPLPPLEGGAGSSSLPIAKPVASPAATKKQVQDDGVEQQQQQQHQLQQPQWVTATQLLANPHYHVIRGLIFHYSAMLWIWCGVAMTVAWAAPWCASIYLVCVYVSYVVWKMQDAARLAKHNHQQQQPPLRDVCAKTVTVLSWSRPLIFVHAVIAVIYVQVGMLFLGTMQSACPAAADWCYFPSHTIHRTYSFIAIIAVLLLLLPVTLLLARVRVLAVAHHQLMFPATVPSQADLVAAKNALTLLALPQAQRQQVMLMHMNQQHQVMMLQMQQQQESLARQLFLAQQHQQQQHPQSRHADVEQGFEYPVATAVPEPAISVVPPPLQPNAVINAVEMTDDRYRELHVALYLAGNGDAHLQHALYPALRNRVHPDDHIAAQRLQ